jgi:hypothetical protein
MSIKPLPRRYANPIVGGDVVRSGAGRGFEKRHAMEIDARPLMPGERGS